MKIEVKHFADPDETITAIPGKVTVEVEPGGDVPWGHGPIDLTLGQQAEVELEVIEHEYPGGGIESVEQRARVAISAVIDTERLVAPGGLTVNPTYAKALGTDEPDPTCGHPQCGHPQSRHTGSRSVEGLKDTERGLATACDEFGCPCGGFREAIEVEPDGYQRHGEDAADRPVSANPDTEQPATDVEKSRQVIGRFQAIDAEEMTESQAMGLCELGGEEPPPGAVVIDTHADAHAEHDIVAFIPRWVDRIEAKDFATRVALLAALGEPTAPTRMSIVEMAKLPQESIDNRIERAAVAMSELGQVEWDVQEDHRKEHFRQLARAAAGVFGFVADPITPEEAETLHAVWAGDGFDAQLLDSVQPKLEAIAGKDWR